ncbi:MAG: type VI secretion system accessory protein TagJ [Pirellulaceae bacterium]|nr:type VI secretion system accessory protein TagJ [Pirellulaceae bacterium]
MSADQTLRDGKVDEALAELTQKVRGNPSDPKLRIFMFQLLAVQGQWERALTQLNVAGELDPGALMMVQMYREAIQCEALRAEVFAGKRSPLVFGEPEEWVALLVESLKLAAEGKHAEAGQLRERAFEAAPATSGTLTVEARAAGTEPTRRDEPFEWLADADSRLGPVIEAVVNGRYYWVPLHRVKQIDVEAPTDLRDMVWTPVHFVWANGGDAVGLIPTRYPGSEKHADPLIRLARKTDWTEPAAGAYFGQGQRMLATDAGDYSLLDTRKITLAAAGGA